MACEERLSYTISWIRSQQSNRETAIDEKTLRSDSNESAEAPIAVTLPGVSPTSHFASEAFHRFTIKCPNARSSTVLQEPARSHDHLHEEDAESSRGRPTCSTSPFEEEHRSFRTGTANRRFGVVDLAGFDDMSGDYQSLMEIIEADNQHDRVTIHSDHPGRTACHDDPATEPPNNAIHDSSAHSSNEAPLLVHGSYLVRHSVEFLVNSELSLSIGKWRCCECRRGHDIYHLGAGEHLISTLSCVCAHRSCRRCNFHGSVRQFDPRDDVAGVASVPVTSDDGKNNQFGVICRTCGLSWRAATVLKPTGHTSLRRRLSILPKKLDLLQKLRHTESIHRGTSLGHRYDGAHLPEEQAPGAEVRFYGVGCTCGTFTDSTSLCFQLVSMVESEARAGGLTKRGRPGMPELRAKGHGTPTLHLKGVSHPNPLCSNPVEDPRE